MCASLPPYLVLLMTESYVFSGGLGFSALQLMIPPLDPSLPWHTLQPPPHTPLFSLHIYLATREHLAPLGPPAPTTHTHTQLFATPLHMLPPMQGHLQWPKP